MRAQNSEVGVFVRLRPTANFARDLIECLPDGQAVNIHHWKDSRQLHERKKSHLSSQLFRFGGVLQDVSQEEVYNRVCHRVVLGALDGYNGTVMCFGQTGSGKTFTMTGSTESYRQRGIIPRAVQEVFQEVEKRTEHAFSVLLSYLEIYNETLIDLLSSVRDSPCPSPHGMTVMEEPGRGVFVRGLSLHPVHNEEEALSLLFEGEMNRIIGSHALNRSSSRSHCIFTVHIESRSRTLSDAKYIVSKLNLVDLAGSERLGKTGSGGQVLKETMYINKSLSFLEQAILALADRRRDHIPFRQSKLTHALKDSLGGNCNTVLVANIYGEAAQIEETLSTLRFASRMKCVQTEPAVNVHIDPAAQIKKLQREVDMLKEELSMNNTLVSKQRVTYEPLSEAQLAEIKSQVQKYLEGSLKEIRIQSVRQVQAVFAQFKLAVQEQEQKVKAQQTDGLTSEDVPAADTGWQTRTFQSSARSTKSDRQAGWTGARSQKSRDRQSQRQRAGNAVGRKHMESSSKSNLSSVQAPEREHKSQDPEVESQGTQESTLIHSDNEQANSPPPKEDAFEDFKMGRGSGINNILKENKVVLLERRGLLRQLTEEVNNVKKEIDGITATIEQHKELREGQYRVMGQESLQQAADLLMQLREMKMLYRQRYEVLGDVKAEVNYCQHLVDQCRVRLLSEFEKWYEKSFLVPDEELGKSMEKISTQEAGDHQPPKESPPDSSSSESFYNARYRTLKRRDSRRLPSTPVQRHLSAGQRRLPPLQHAN